MFGALYNICKKRIAMISSNLIMNLNPLMSQNGQTHFKNLAANLPYDI